MNKLNSTAKKLDTFFKVFQIMLAIAAVTLLVAAAIVAAAFLFDLPAEAVGTGYNSLSLSFLDLTVAEEFAPDPRQVLIVLGVISILAFPVCLLGRVCIKTVRAILAPMIENRPFSTDIAANLKKLAKYTLILGIAANILLAAANGMMLGIFDLESLLIGEKITQITFCYDLDLSFLVVWGTFLLLSYVFQYGEQLQQLSDETL